MWASFSAAFLLTSTDKRTHAMHDGGLPAEVGHVSSERVARLCGDHSEHCYEAVRLTTHGTTCVSVAYHADTPTAAAASAAVGACISGGSGSLSQLLVCGTSNNNIAVFNAATSSCIAQHSKGPRRYCSTFTPSLSHVAVWGDPVAPAIELQLCSQNKFAFLEGHTGGEVSHVSVSV